MPRIIRAIVKTESASNPNHSVQLDAPGYFTNLTVESVNGIYLRKGDVVFVYVDDTFTSPLILGRATGQLELTELVNVINALVDIINNNKDVFDNHGHSIDTANALLLPVVANPQGTPPFIIQPVPAFITTPPKRAVGTVSTSFKKASKIKEDDLLK